MSVWGWVAVGVVVLVVLYGLMATVLWLMAWHAPCGDEELDYQLREDWD